MLELGALVPQVIGVCDVVEAEDVVVLPKSDDEDEVLVVAANERGDEGVVVAFVPMPCPVGDTVGVVEVRFAVLLTLAAAMLE